MHQSLNSI